MRSNAQGGIGGDRRGVIEGIRSLRLNLGCFAGGGSKFPALARGSSLNVTFLNSGGIWGKREGGVRPSLSLSLEGTVASLDRSEEDRSGGGIRRALFFNAGGVIPGLRGGMPRWAVPPGSRRNQPLL